MKDYTVFNKTIGNCLTKSWREDYEKQVSRFAEFVNVSQFDKRPKHVSEIGGQLLDKPVLHTATVLYGVEEDGSLTWLAEIIDSSD